MPYTTVEVDPVSKAEIKFSKDYRKVPIMTLDDEQVNDSPVIMNRLLFTLAADPQYSQAIGEHRTMLLQRLISSVLVSFLIAAVRVISLSLLSPFVRAVSLALV